VKFVATADGVVRSMNNIVSAPRIEECEFIVSLPPGNVGPTFGLESVRPSLKTWMMVFLKSSRVIVVRSLGDLTRRSLDAFVPD